LLVDDEPDITIAFKITLENAGFIVYVYQDPIIALSKFKPSYYDLVILDIKMQKMNGLASKSSSSLLINDDTLQSLTSFAFVVNLS
jgi:DNA-binding response OmpR family regulator